MDIDTKYGECRCCLTKGYHKDLSREYKYGEKFEIYSDIFIDCFNLFLSSDTRLSSLICKACIKQLKDSYHFKMTVMSLENKMLKSLTEINGRETVFLDEMAAGIEDIKHEIKDVVKEELDLASDTDNLSMNGKGDEDIPEVHGEKELLSRFSRSSVKPLPTRSAFNLLCPGYMKHLEDLKGKIIKARMLQELIKEPSKPRTIQKKRRKEIAKPGSLNHSNSEISNSTNITPLSEKMAQISNITTLLANSNLTAFMTKFKNGYPCFYCKKIFEKFEVLREHQIGHSKIDIDKMILKRYKKGRPDSLVVYVDVTDLKCMICGEGITNLNELKSHLTKQHEKTIHSNFSDRVIPFRISDKYLCQVCGFNFETFGAIERHMNTHYRNFVCENCGAGFIAKHRLKIHTYNIHSVIGKFPCDICNKVFPTHRKFKIHNDFVHKLSKKLQCPKCPARFSYYYVRQKHLLDVHGELPVVYKCNVCDKEFKRRYPLSIHIKKEHLSQGDFDCEVCGYTCFSSNELRVHAMKRHGDKFVGKDKDLLLNNYKQLDKTQM